MPALSATLAAVNAAQAIPTDVPVQGAGGVAVGLVTINITGNLVGTLVFEGTTDGSTWFAIAAHPLLASGFHGGPILSTTAGAGQFCIPVYGYAAVRIRCSVFTSGSASVALDASGDSPLGYSFVNTEGQKATYSYAAEGITPVATPTDLLTLTGSATKTGRLTRLSVNGLATAAGSIPLILIKRSTADSGGTSTTPAGVPHDSNDAAASLTLNQYSANPAALGTAVGNLRAKKLALPLAGTPGNEVVWEFNRQSRFPVLRGTAQQLALNLAGATLPAGTALDFDIEWTEE